MTNRKREKESLSQDLSNISLKVWQNVVCQGLIPNQVALITDGNGRYAWAWEHAIKDVVDGEYEH